MAVSLRKLPFILWKSNIERKGIATKFQPIFEAYIGTDNIQEYNDYLATINKHIEDDSTHSILFDNDIFINADFNFINNIKSELKHMDLNNITSKDIEMFSDSSLNDIFINAFNYILKRAINLEKFQNESIRDNFIVKMLLFTYTYITKLDFSSEFSNKCFYYGAINRHSFYFLLMLYKMGFDVIYINPINYSSFFSEIDLDNIVHLNEASQKIDVLSFKKRAEKGTVIKEVFSSTLEIETEINSALYTNGIYKPWQFRNGTTEPLMFNGNIIDLTQNWKEPAKLRQGFSSKDKIVYVPNFFMEIEGEYRDRNEYLNFVQPLIKDSYFINSTNNLITNYDEKNKFKLTFCQDNQGLYNIEKLKELDFYKYAPYNDETEDFILKKLNETLSDKTLFKNELSKEEKLDLSIRVLNLSVEVLRLIDGFDFPNQIPKIIYLLENDNQVSKQDTYILAYLNKIGFDILILSPAGLSNFDSFITPHKFVKVRLEEMIYDETKDKLSANIKNNINKSKGFLKRLFS